MRVLIVAPEQSGINAIPEVRMIQQWHHTSTLNGMVTAQDVFKCCQETAFDVIHFASHGGPEGIALSDGDVLDAEDIAQVARLKDTQGLFFNSCQAGKLAAYAVRHGPLWAVAAEIELQDDGAWKMPMAFYSALRNGHARDWLGAYMVADSGDGDYSLQVSPAHVQALQHKAATAILPRRDAVVLSRWQMVWFALGIVAASGAWTMLLNALSGR